MKLAAIFRKKGADIAWMSGLIILATLFRLFLMRYHFAIGWDEPHYLQIASTFAKGQFTQGLHPYWSPMYPLCVGVASFILQNLEISGRIVSILFSALTLIPFFFFSKQLFSTRFAYLSTAFLAFYPPLAFSASYTMAEPTLVFFVMMGIFMGWRTIRKQSILMAVVTGLLFGFAYLTKPEGAGYFSVFMGIAGIWILSNQFGRDFRKWFILFIVIISFIITASPYLIYLRQHTGQWTISSKVSANQQFEANEFADSYFEFWSLSEDNTRLPMDAIFHDGDFSRDKNMNTVSSGRMNLKALFIKYLTNLYKMLKYEIPQIFSLILLVLLFVGLFWKNDSKSLGLKAYLLFFISIFWFIVIPLFHVNQRYMLPGFILSFIWIGRGAIIFTREVPKTINQIMQPKYKSNIIKKLGPAIIWGLVLIFILLPHGFEFGKVVIRTADSVDEWADAVELKQAGQWIFERSSNQHPVIMSYNKAVDFYAGCYDIRKGASFSIDSFDRILDYARYRNVQYLVVSERHFRKFPNLKFLFQDQNIPGELELIYDDQRPSPTRVRIFLLRSSVDGE